MYGYALLIHELLVLIGRNVMKRYFVFVLSIMMLASFSPVGADWRDDLKELKEKGRAASEQVKKAGREVRDGAKSTKKRWDDGASKRREIYDNTKKLGLETKETFNQNLEKGKNVYKEVKKTYSKNIDKIADPEVRRKAMETFDKGMELRQKFKEAKRNSVSTGIDALADMPIGGKTFGDIVGERLANEFPSLERSGLIDRDTAIAVVLSDKPYFLNEVDLVKKGGRRVSVIQAINETSPFDTDKTSKYINIAISLDKLNSAEDVGGAVNGLIGAMDAVSGGN